MTETSEPKENNGGTAAKEAQHPQTNLFLQLCVYDKDHMGALQIKNTSESDPRSYEVT